MNLSIKIPEEPTLIKSWSRTSVDTPDSYRAINAVTRPGKDIKNGTSLRENGTSLREVPFTTSPSLAALRQDSSYSTKDS